MKILVTGGAGFIASHIVDAYISDGHEVVVIDNLSTGKHENINPRAKFYEMDICDSNVAEIFEAEKPHILNHHAAQIDICRSVADPLFDLKVNVGGLINLIEAGRKHSLNKVIFASSGGAIYGEQKIFPATEEHQLRPVSPYGLNKLAGEQYLHYAQREYGISWVSLRYANVYGPRQNPNGEAGVIAIFIKKMIANETPVINGNGKQTRDYVYISDVVEANRIALEDKAGGPYNIGTGVETDVNTVFGAIRELVGAGCVEKHGPVKHREQLRSSISPKRIESVSGWISKVSLSKGIALTAKWFSLR